VPHHISALPADAVLVHIGPHKTGTTAIQSTLGASRDELRAHGVIYPGKGSAHHGAARALRQYGEGWAHSPENAPDPAVWTNLAQRVRQVPGRVLLSSEFFAQADDEARAKLVNDLGAERVYLLAGARNPAAIAVSTWQQVLRQGYPVTLDEWLAKQFYRAEPAPNPGPFWSFADCGLLISRWAEVVDPDRITVVVLDESDRRLLPTTFEQLLDLPEGLLADQKPPFANRGLSAVEAALIREIIVTLDSRLSWAEYTRVMRKGVIRRVLERQPGPEEPKLRLPLTAAEQAVAEAEHTIETLLASGVRIVGDLESLRTTPPSTAASAPITDVPLDVAAEAVVGAVAVAIRGSWSLDAQAAKPTPAPVSPPVQPRPRRSKGTPVDSIPTRALVAVLRKRVRAGMRRRYRRWRRGPN
jgi:hypothetical protein